MLASAVVGNQMLAIGGTATGSTSGASSHRNVYVYPSGGVSPSFGSITGGYTVTISGVITNGAGANAFSILDPAGGGINFPFSIPAGTASNFSIRFAPPNAAACTAAVQLANNSATTPSIVYLAGTGAKHDQTIANFMPTNGAAFIVSNAVGLSATASSGLPVSFTNAAGSPVSWQNATTITFTATGQASIIAAQAGNTNWNTAPSNQAQFVTGGSATLFTGVYSILPRPSLFTHYLDVDLDGDGKTDPAVYNIYTGAWYFALSGSGYVVSTSSLGGPDDDPVGFPPVAGGE